MSKEYKVNFLHVYSQYAWHDDALIAGDRGALEALRDAIDAALKNSPRHPTPRAELFVNDGEGYHLHVLLLEKEQMQKIAVPYIDEIAAAKFDKTNDPSRLVRP